MVSKDFAPKYGPKQHTVDGHVLRRPSFLAEVSSADQLKGHYPGIEEGDVIACYGELSVILKGDGSGKLDAGFPRNRELLDELGLRKQILVFDNSKKSS